MTAHANPAVTAQSRQPWTNMFRGDKKPEWRELIVRHPDRFVFALDNVWALHGENDYGKQVAYWRQALADLPPEAAAALAHGNAGRRHLAL